MKWVIYTTTLLVTLCLVHGIPKQQYPRIRGSQRVCWNHTSAAPADLLVCDPNKLVSESQLKQLQDAASEIRSFRLCPCSSYVCQTERLRGRDHGYTVTIALVRSMDEPAGNVVSAAGNYSVYLRNERGYGALARCQDDIIVFLSYDEKVLYILTGNMAMNVVTNAEVSDIIEQSKSRFASELFDGIKYILDRIKAEILK